MKNKLLILLTALVIVLSSALVVSAFDDVTENDWFYSSVKRAEELGLMKGVSDTEFAPKTNVKLSMAVTMAARVHAIVNFDEPDFTGGENWYDPYVKYARDNGIITGEFDFNADATRLDVAHIFYMALPSEALYPVNTVDDGMIPDVENDEAVYALYRAGIFAGSDSTGAFNGEKSITRAEISAVVSRLLDISLRQSITLEADHEAIIRELLDAEFSFAANIGSIDAEDTEAVDMIVAIAGFDPTAVSSEFKIAYLNYMKAVYSDFEFTVGDITREGVIAYADVTFTSKNLAALAEEHTEELEKIALDDSYESAEDKYIAVFKYSADVLNSVDAVSRTGSLKLERTAGSWEIDDSSLTELLM